MSDATDRLARSRQAIIAHIARRERRHDPREEGARWQTDEGDGTRREPPPRGASLFERARHATGIWWRHHPAHMALEVATPLIASYAGRKPVQFIAVAALAGAALTLTRPWRLISVTTLLVAVVKATQLPSVLMSAMSAADFERDQERPG